MHTSKISEKVLRNCLKPPANVIFLSALLSDTSACYKSPIDPPGSQQRLVEIRLIFMGDVAMVLLAIIRVFFVADSQLASKNSWVSFGSLRLLCIAPDEAPLPVFSTQIIPDIAQNI